MRSKVPARPRRLPASPRWQRRPEARPAEILAAALDVFIERGFSAARLDEVARRSGISKGTLYLYYESKEALFKAVIRENVVRLLERAERQLETYSGSSRDLIAELLRGWWNAMNEARLTGLPKLMLAEAANFPDLARFYFEEVVERGRRLFARALRRGISSGEFREVDVEYTVRVIMAPIVLAQIWKHSMVKCQIDPLDFDRHLQAVVDLVVHGLERTTGKGARRG